jgi:hypothetical protein
MGDDSGTPATVYPSMPRRLVAWLLLSVFLGAGTTLPGPDALLHRWTRQADEHRTHLEPAGGCGAHAEKCTLGRTATGAGATLVQAPILRTQLFDSPARAVTQSADIVPADLGAKPPSRAPPAFAA